VEAGDAAAEDAVVAAVVEANLYKVLKIQHVLLLLATYTYESCQLIGKQPESSLLDINDLFEDFIDVPCAPFIGEAHHRLCSKQKLAHGLKSIASQRIPSQSGVICEFVRFEGPVFVRQDRFGVGGALFWLLLT
jgi:hypothetical protein